MHFSLSGLKVVNVDGRHTEKILHIWSDAKYNLCRCYPENTFVLEEKYWKCGLCKKVFTREEYKSSWDHNGPNCPNPKCANGGMALFAETCGPIRQIPGWATDMVTKQNKHDHIVDIDTLRKLFTL